MAKLENFDPAALPWAEWSDGRPRRLKRGKHYVGDPRTVQRAARAAAVELDKGVVSTTEQLAKWEYIWVQFADQSIEEGEPCRCGGRHFARHHVLFGRCEVCGRTTVLREPKEPVGDPAASGPVSEALADPEFGRVTGIRIISAEGHGVDELPIDAEAVVQATFEAPRGDLLASPRVTLRTDVIKAFVTGPRKHWRVEHPGPYHVEMRIPPDILAPQAYSLEFNMRVRNGDRKKLVRGVPLPLLAFDPASRRNRREGVLRPRFEWAVRDEHGVEPVVQELKTADEPLDPDDGFPGSG